ncbi:hypothetical protein GCM10010168_57750 [Actinoplanes ianthinogenes]|uniref:Uncharacterized protein n=1 Tax=Actinoplanes ianthinogenes TaxID=122358 RepID=A0ABN6CLG8_9ACTN|nr:hypothetical protein [Actinoplanes ianthinogenes]BCJ45805.1 hypothetical protein Aiant_64620 [Actinoplanes ianthinogenes]GGR31873.1 hypothetical protein GCM10010168_57750 [Actinoplanes ianthinogenes]
MVSTLFALIAVAELVLLTLLLRLPRGWVPTLLILVLVALIGDNAVIASGRLLGAGPLLHALSIPRFVTHALLVPLLIMVGVGLGRRHRVGWLQRRTAPAAFGALTALMIALGVFQDVAALDLQPKTYADTIRYTNAAAAGPPIPAIVAIGVLIAIGIAVQITTRHPWLLIGSLTMLIAAGVGAAVPWLGNLGELLLALTLWQTAKNPDFVRSTQTIRG